jgi:hypothetical protein
MLTRARSLVEACCIDEKDRYDHEENLYKKINRRVLMDILLTDTAGSVLFGVMR